MRPNWHAILIHYPVALLTVGLAVEWLTLGYRRGTLRQAGLWSLLRDVGAMAQADDNLRVRRYAVALLKTVVDQMNRPPSGPGTAKVA